MKMVKIKMTCGKFKVPAETLTKFEKELDATSYEDRYADLVELAKRNKEILAEFASFLTFEEQEFEAVQPETTQEIKLNYNKEFIKQILAVLKDKNYRIHATSNAKDIMESGLRCFSPDKDIAHTSKALVNNTDNEILFDLFNLQHFDQKQIMILDADSSDLIKTGKYYTLPTKFIKGYIDISTQQVVLNPAYEPVNHVTKRVVTNKNEEITSTGSFDAFNLKAQIKCFEEMVRTKCEQAYDHCLHEIYEFLRGVIANYASTKTLQPCTHFNSQQEIDEFKYFLGQLENEVKRFTKKAEKKLLAEEKKNAKKRANTTTKSPYTIDETDSLF